ncbi:TerD family protein [Klebsiella pneumoniae]|uniref:TerD family protein n=1 Tax=Klebsiella pneumoniae TaxID=573 RepID=UPI003D9BDD16
MAPRLHALFRFQEDASTETAMIFGELYRHGAEWKFKAVGQGFAGGLAARAGNPARASTSDKPKKPNPGLSGVFSPPRDPFTRQQGA